MSIESIVNLYKYKDLNGDDIKKSLGKYPINYEDLKNYNSIEDLCPISSPYQILFLQNSKFNGHFTAEIGRAHV